MSKSIFQYIRILDASPVVDYIFVLAVKIVLDVVTVARHLSYNLISWFQGVGADRTLFLVSSTFSPARGVAAGSSSSRTWHRIESGPTE